MIRKVIIQNRAGLHARPISKFVEVAGKFDSKLIVRFNDQDVNGKSIIELMTLGAYCGAELQLISEGEDCESQLDSLEELILSGFKEAY